VIVTELRASKSLPNGKKAIRVGYFDDPERFAAAARELNDAGYDIYTPVNPIKPEIATNINHRPQRGPAARKAGIARRIALFYDFDVNRPIGKAASAAEIEVAKPAIERCVADWRKAGVNPKVTYTGNGFQLEVPIDLPNNDLSETLVKKVLEVHKAKYDIPNVVHLDCFKDANRICRVAGFKNWKGDNSPDRPRRIVRVLNEAAGLASRELLENIAKDWTKLPPSSGSARGTGAADEEALAVLKGAYLRSGRVWSSLKSARKHDLKLSGDHSTIVSFANFLNNSWEEDREDRDGLQRILETIWDECGTSADGGRTQSEVEDILDHAFAKERKLRVIRDKSGDELDPPYVRPCFAWPSPTPSSRERRGPVWIFNHESDYALFKHRVEQTPAWANAAEWKDPEGWPELPDYEAWRSAQPPIENGFKFPRVQGQVREYTLLPLRGKYDGWFGRGRVSLVGGSSGAGKTSLICDMLDQQRNHHSVLGHIGAGLRPLVIFADRGELSNAETLDRLGLDGRLPIAHLSVCWDDAAVQGILKLIEKQNHLPEVVFVEGADTLVSDAAKTQAVAPFLGDLQKIAAHYHIALVLSVGAPKSKPREQHTLRRDRILGSQIWPRMADTILTLEAVGDGTGARRNLAVQHRNAPSENFDLEFQGGRLVQRFETANMDALDMWIWERDPESWFTRDEAVDAMKNGETGLKKTAVYDRLKKMLDCSALEKHWNKDKKKEQLRPSIQRAAVELDAGCGAIASTPLQGESFERRC
jgi:hypothetical protein